MIRPVFTGLLTCGRDGAALERGAVGRTGDSRAVYRCPTCGLSAVAQAVEDVITDAVLDQLASARFQRALRATTAETVDAYREELDAVDANIAALQRHRDGLLADVTRAERLARLREDSTTLRDRWPTLTAEVQRDVLEAVLGSVVVRPASKRGRVFDRTRVAMTLWPDATSDNPGEGDP